MKIRRWFACVMLMALAACSNTVPDASVSVHGVFPQPSDVQVKYLGPARSDQEGDPISGCRVYVFRVEGYYQTAVWCPNGKASVSSSGHERKSADDSQQQIVAAQ